jgi:capsular exopolysaccharide synthesis family protein
VELAFLQGDLSREEEVFERIASRLMALRTEQRAPERVNRLQSAEVPTAPVVSVATLYKKMGLACFGSFLLPFALAVLRERLLQRVGDVRQLREDLHLPVVGQIAQLPLRAHSLQQTASRRAREDLQLFQESVDALRVCLMTSESLQDMRVLAVTSAANNEGKTSVAVQLAVSIAGACGEKTLLIDGDLRSPDVHRVLGVAGRPGLAELLAHECRIEDGAIQNWSNRLLGNGAFGELLEELRRRYRYIVIDTPPVLAASEAVILARAADACLLCAMRDVSRVEQVREVGSRLAVAGAEPVGIVLSGIPSRQYGYYYGRYSYKIEA